MSIESLYNKKVLDHFLHPRNMGTIKNPSGIGRVGNPTCGDVMELYLKIDNLPVGKAGRKSKMGKIESIITEVKFKTFGCGAAIASSSMLTEMIKGKSVQKVQKITNQAVSKSLGGLPAIKRHCSVLARQALAKALKDWQKKGLIK